MFFRFLHLSLITLFLLAGCSTQDSKLPIFGERDVVSRIVDGKTLVDTIYHTIPAFSFTNQDGQTITNRTFDSKIYVADFFFTTCPTICPKMKTQMKRVYDRFKNNPDVMILSHTINPRHDTPAILKKFANELGVTGNQWQFVTGPREKIFEIGMKSYMVVAQEDQGAPGGVIHSGYFILVDKEKHVRGMYDGTTEKDTDRLIIDIDNLLAEYNQ